VKVSKRTEYGLRAIVTLAILSQEGDQAIPLREIAVAEEIPEQFLDQIFALLRREGFVKSVRGPHGGYVLNRPAVDIRMGEVIKALEGTLGPIGCVVDDHPGDFCEKFQSCHTRNVWLRLSDSITKTLQGISLADVMHDEIGV